MPVRRRASRRRRSAPSRASAAVKTRVTSAAGGPGLGLGAARRCRASAPWWPPPTGGRWRRSARPAPAPPRPPPPGSVSRATSPCSGARSARIGSPVRAISIADAERHPARQAQHRAAGGEQADLDLGDAELGALRRHQEVAREGDLEAAGQGEPLDRGDQRLAEPLLQEADEAGRRARRRERLEVHAGREAPAGAGEHAGAELLVGVEPARSASSSGPSERRRRRRSSPPGG